MNVTPREGKIASGITRTCTRWRYSAYMYALSALLDALRTNGTRTRSSSGFTLIELLVVIVVLGVLASVVIFAVGNVSAQAAVSACKADAASVEIAVHAYEAESGGVPPSSLSDLTQGTDPYLQSLPSSPYYALTLQNGVVMVAAPSSASPVAFDGGDVCNGANSPSLTTLSPTTTVAPTSTTIATTTTTIAPTTTTTAPPTTTIATTTTTIAPTTTTTSAPAPTISFPTTTRPYDAGHNAGRETLRITGTNLENATSVSVSGAFSGVTVVSDSATSIVITLTGSGGNKATGNLTVTTPGGTALTVNSLVNGGRYNG